MTTSRSSAALLFLLGASLAPAPAAAVPFAEPDPPALVGPPGAAEADELWTRGVAPTTEWVLHKSADGLHPDQNEQAMMWLMNRARMDPTAEGVWLATETDPDVQGGRDFFGVNTTILQQEFAALSPTPPAAFDRRLWDAARLHSLDLIDRDTQDHVGQGEKVDASGFDYTDGRLSVFSFADSALNAHAAFNIDWGPGDGTGMQPGRGHRAAIMGNFPNVGISMIPENDGGTSVGPLVTTANYFVADTGTADHFNRFLVGTVWDDLDMDGVFDPGEGLEGVTVMPDQGVYFAVTSEGGGWAIPILAPGSYDVAFTGGELQFAYSLTAVVGTGSAELSDPAPLPEPGAALHLALGAALLAPLAVRRSRRASR